MAPRRTRGHLIMLRGGPVSRGSGDYLKGRDLQRSLDRRRGPLPPRACAPAAPGSRPATAWRAGNWAPARARGAAAVPPPPHPSAKGQHGALPHRAEGGEVGNAGYDARRIPAALDAADAAAQGYASAVSGAMLIKRPRRTWSIITAHSRPGHPCGRCWRPRRKKRRTGPNAAWYRIRPGRRLTNKPPLTRPGSLARGEAHKIQETAPLFVIIDKTDG